MKNVITLLRRFVGCFGISFFFALFIFGCVVFPAKLTELDDVSIVPFTVAFVFMLALLVACNLLYLANKTLWNAVEDAKENSDHQNLLQLLPNVKFFVDMCEYVGTFNQDSAP